MTPNQIRLRDGLSSPSSTQAPQFPEPQLASPPQMMPLDDLLDNLAEMSGHLQAAFTRQIAFDDILQQADKLLVMARYNVNLIREKLHRVELADSRLSELATHILDETNSNRTAR